MTDLEAEIHRIGTELHAALPGAAAHPIRTVDTRAMELAARDRELRAALFRFVDVVPACRSVDDVARHLGAFLAEAPAAPAPVGLARRAAGSRPGRAALGLIAAGGVRHMAHRFIVGADPERALPVLGDLWRGGITSSVDLLGEATVTAEEGDRYAGRCRDALERIAAAAHDWPQRPGLESDSSGPLPRANVSVKISALTPLLRPDAPARGRDDAAGRLRALLRRARDLGAHIHVDMESLDSREAVTELVLLLLAEPEFRRGPSTGVVLQAYLRDSIDQLDELLAWVRATDRRPPLTVRLVKGAYWDHELVEAAQHGWRPPVFEVKAECDRNFELLTRRLVDARPHVRVAIASHNLRSLAHAIAAAGEGTDLELQVLRGLGDELAEALAAGGRRVRAYCPVGDLVAGMAYLVRRLLENTANESFLAAQARGAPLQELLAAP